ncbi:hypothetical protein KIPB_003895 [Kipferlia bialata]|uniref:Uncharacterized protein n=1 Tax=Kipferlia bialata TaxID=797122 RepID=A0A9K3GG58_9EUKA|nr:hypothetical protein KIPB_003895 [Kipferlia bialata]|eukprot:g3895.t1
MFLGLFVGDSLSLGGEEDFSVIRPTVALDSASDEAPSTAVFGTDSNYTGGDLLIQAGSGETGGDLVLEAGEGDTDGSILIGTSSSATVSIGSAASTTHLLGALVFEGEADVYIPSLSVGALNAPTTATDALSLDSPAGVALGSDSPIVDIGSDVSAVTLEADSLNITTEADVLVDSAGDAVFNVGAGRTMGFEVGGVSVFSLFDEEITDSGIYSPKGRGGGMTVTVPTTYTNTVTMGAGKTLTVDTISTVGSNTLAISAPVTTLSHDLEVGGDLDVTGDATAASVTATTGAFDSLSVTSGGTTVYTLPAAAGTDGQVLGYGSTGPEWVDASSGSGSTDLTGTTLTVSGASSLASATVSDTLSMTAGKALTVDTIGTIGTNTLSVSAPTVGFSADVSVGNDLTVTGDTSLAGLTTSGAATVASLGVTGAATVGSTLSVTGAVSGASVTSSAGSFDSLSVTSGGSALYTFPATAGTLGQRLVAGATSLVWETPSTTLSGTTLTVSGASSLTTLTVTGASTLAGASFSDHVTFTAGKTLTVDAVTATTGNNLTLTALSVDVSGALDVSGATTVDGLTDSGATSLTSLTVSGTAALDSLGVTGAVTAGSVSTDSLSITSGASTVYSLPTSAGTEGQVLGVEASGVGWVTPASGSSGYSADSYIWDFTVSSGTTLNSAGGPYSVAVGDHLRAFADGTCHSIQQTPDSEPYDNGVMLGVALTSAAAGETVSVMVGGGFYTGYTGLIPGTPYYSDYVDSTPTTDKNNGQYIGVAMSATVLHIQQGGRTNINYM